MHHIKFHEKYEFFILWGMFPIVMLITGLLYIRSTYVSIYSFIPLPIFALLDKFIHKFLKWSPNVCVINSSICLGLTLLRNDFYITYSMLLQFYAWFYAIQYCTLEDSKTHFPFYGMVMIYSYPLLTFINNYFTITNLIHYSSIITLHLFLMLLLLFNSPKTNYSYNKLNKKNYYVPILVFIYHWLHQDSSNQLYISINHSFVTNIGKIQYGVIGVSVFISALIAHLYKNLHWIYIMITYSAIDFIIVCTILPIINVHFTEELKIIYHNIMNYLLVIPSILMMVTQQKPYNTLIQLSSYIFVYSIANMIPYYDHPAIHITAFVIWCITCKLVSDFNDQEIDIRENSCDDCQLIEIN